MHILGPSAMARQCSPEQGQIYINEGRYRDAIREFSCLVEAQPTQVEGYRGLIEAELLLGRYSDAVRDYARVTAFVLPVHPDAEARIAAGYAARLAAAPNDIPALTGASFARWWFFDYPAAIHLLNDLLALRPIDVYGNLFRGSSRLLKGTARAEGMADLDLAIGFAPESPDVRFIVADAYTSARWLTRSGRSRQRRLPWQEVLIRHAFMPFLPAHILLGNQSAAAAEIRTHMELVTTELVQASVLSVGDTDTFPRSGTELQDSRSCHGRTNALNPDKQP
jgi:tetratricopeptide (TPR) repeat protein